MSTLSHRRRPSPSVAIHRRASKARCRSGAGSARRRRRGLLVATLRYPRKVLCAGANYYYAHLREMGVPRPEGPVEPVGARNPVHVMRLLIFVEEADDAIVSVDLADVGRRGVGEWPCGSGLRETAVGR